MISLDQKTLTSLSSKASPMPLADAKAHLKELFHWDIVLENGAHKLERTYKFADFGEALAFTKQVGELAEQYQHHPTITLKKGKVTVLWWTDSIGGLHENNFIMAAKCNDLYQRWDNVYHDKDTVQQNIEESFPASDAPGSKIIE